MKLTIIAAILGLVGLVGCSDPADAPHVQKTVRADSAGITTVTTPEGWTVELNRAEVALTNLTFTTFGEAHASLLDRVSDTIIPNAWAHPGHLAGGEVIGELPGTFVVDLTGNTELGVADLIVAEYDGANFRFAQHDSLGGASLILGGSATNGEQQVAWTASITQDDTRTVTGLPMPVDLTTTEIDALGLQFLTADPTSDATLFDELDFGTEAVLDITPGSENGVRLLRATQRHDFWQVVPR